MRILLDTHCWLWMHAAPERFSPSARRLVASTEHELVLSAASAWEISIKSALGRLQLPLPAGEYVESRIAMTHTSTLPITVAHALRAGELPARHRDPFDRMIVAQAQIEGLPILTVDPRIAAYDVEIIDATS